MTANADKILPAPPVLERDDIGKLPLSSGAKAYARRSGLKSMMRQPHDFAEVNAEITNAGRPNVVRNYAVGQSTDGKPVDSQVNAIKEAAELAVERLLG